MPYVSDWTQPAKLGKSLGMPFWGNLKPVVGVSGGDFTCAPLVSNTGTDQATPNPLFPAAFPVPRSHMPTSSLLRCLLSLFFDNLSTMLGITGAFLYVCKFDQVAEDIVYEAC